MIITQKFEKIMEKIRWKTQFDKALKYDCIAINLHKAFWIDGVKLIIYDNYDGKQFMTIWIA